MYLTSRPRRDFLGEISRAVRQCLSPLRSLVQGGVSDSLAILQLPRVGLCSAPASKPNNTNNVYFNQMVHNEMLYNIHIKCLYSCDSFVFSREYFNFSIENKVVFPSFSSSRFALRLTNRMKYNSIVLHVKHILIIYYT